MEFITEKFPHQQRKQHNNNLPYSAKQFSLLCATLLHPSLVEFLILLSAVCLIPKKLEGKRSPRQMLPLFDGKI